MFNDIEMEEQVQTQRVHQAEDKQEYNTGGKSVGFLAPPKLLSQGSSSQRSDNYKDLSKTDISINLPDIHRRGSNFPRRFSNKEVRVKQRANMNMLEKTIEFTFEQLSWKNKSWCRRIYLILGYCVYLAFTILLIIIGYYATRGTNELSKYQMGDKMTKVLDMTNVTRMIYIFKNNPEDI